jgi:hypothetical protein
MTLLGSISGNLFARSALPILRRNQRFARSLAMGKVRPQPVLLSAVSAAQKPVLHGRAGPAFRSEHPGRRPAGPQFKTRASRRPRRVALNLSRHR